MIKDTAAARKRPVSPPPQIGLCKTSPEIVDDQKLDHQRGTTDHPDDQSRKPAKRLEMRHGAKGNDQSERKGTDQRHNK